MAFDVGADEKTSIEAETTARGKNIIQRLRKGELPQMVDWFDPGLLAKVGVRSIISATLGSYTDQRLIQASTDNVSEDRLKNRYNFSGEGSYTGGERPVVSEALPADKDGAVWVDYVADLGDGFEATYAMAYLLAADELKVTGESTPLPAGKLLIMGGDQVYPDATKQEYHNRLRDPYDWAFQTQQPNRKLFAIPGNHDWYDGLSAFSALFCSARDRISKGEGAQIGGWRCHQHRSYFAIRLPYNWWIWGPDIQLADNLDDSQRDYFDLMAEQTGPEDKIILCLAEPSWLHKNYDNMHEISMLARKKGAKICAILAGDWHHYSRYASDKLGIQFITAGGGGAFAHATHGLKPEIALKWATPTDAQKTVAHQKDTIEFNRLERSVVGRDGRDFTQKRSLVQTTTAEKPAAETPAQAAVAPNPKPITDTDAGAGGIGSPPKRSKVVRKEEIKSDAYACEAKSIYPPQWTSRLLCLKNLALPFRNRPFTYLVGIVYFIYAWSFVAADPRQSPIAHSLIESTRTEVSLIVDDVAKLDQQILVRKRSIKPDSDPVLQTPLFKQINEEEKARLAALEAQRDEKGKQQATVQTRLTRQELNTLEGRLKQVFEDKALTSAEKFKAVIPVSLGFLLDFKALMGAAEQSPIFAFMLLGLWAGLMFYVESESKLVKFVIGTIHAAAHITALIVISWLSNVTGFLPQLLFGQFLGGTNDIVRVAWNILVALFAGGLVGGFIMGLYWTLTSTILNMHTGDAFGALGIKDYKNFLRIKLEPDRATIYAIALDRVPGPSGWRAELKPNEIRPSHHPQILPVKPLEPRLIEPPIRIDPSKVLS